MKKTQYTHHVAMIVPDKKREQASALADAEGRVSTRDEFDAFFSVALSPDGQLPATHWGCHTLMRAGLWDRLPQMKNALGDGEWIATKGDGRDTGETFDKLAESMGLRVIHEVV